MSDKKALIQELISLGKTEEALEQLEQLTSDAILLQARYNGAKKQYNMGLIEFSEWSRIQAQINYSALEMVNTVKWTTSVTSHGPSEPSTAMGNNQSKTGPSVFISYSWHDKEVVQKVKAYLENAGCQVTIDVQDMKAAQEILEFIQQSIKKCDVVLSVVSTQSLISGWVGQESLAAFYAIWLADKKFIPVKLDDVSFDIKFQIAVQKGIQTKLQELDEGLQELKSIPGADTRAFDEDRNKLVEIQNNLGKIIQKLKSVLTLDISGTNFEPNMQKVLASIQSN
ncbi:MAG: toll/interleukin-1 receptor domain-containing protein [Saprospiraceae bacterium]|nr:toll/interleukin-1 receptor domain-containing protein [Saprospiraceae bacterium]